MCLSGFLLRHRNRCRKVPDLQAISVLYKHAVEPQSSALHQALRGTTSSEAMQQRPALVRSACRPVLRSASSTPSSIHMIIHCPKCGYSRKPSDTAPATECPECGVIFEAFLSPSPRRPVVVRSKTDQRPATASPSEPPASAAPTAEAKVTSCPACGGTVAYGAKTCPHCGTAKPAPKPPTKVTKTHLVLAALFLIAMIGIQVNKPAPMTADEVTKICAKEAGLDVNSSRPMTMQDLRIIDACVKRFGFKTNP